MASDSTTSLHGGAQPALPVTGLVCGTGAYLWWGLIPIYFKWMEHMPPVFVLGHRIFWSFVFFTVLVGVERRWRQVLPSLASGKILLTLAASGILVAVNWGTFIWAISTGRVLQSSLGYFIVPLVSVTLGTMVLRERFSRWQMLAISLATSGVVLLTVSVGQLPWIALTLAFSFGAYGLIRKTVPVPSLMGLAVETAMLLPLALAMVILFPTALPAPVTIAIEPHAVSTMDYALLALAGPVTGIPLILFSIGARRLRLSTLGFLQYLAPTGQFFLALFVYKERFTTLHFAGFALIWIALAVYSTDSYRAYRTRRKTVSAVSSDPIPE